MMQESKLGEPLSACQDVAVVSWPQERLALTLGDGATSGYDSGWWAWLLASSVDHTLQRGCQLSESGHLADCVEQARQEWARRPRKVGDAAQQLMAKRRAASTPGAATLIALTTRDAGQGKLAVEGIAVGDSMAVVVDVGPDGGSVCHVAPANPVFTSEPRLITSQRSGEGQTFSGDGVEKFSWEINTDCWILAMSDALAEWAWGRGPRSDAWRVLAHIGPPEFERLISKLRASGELVNDDVVLVRARRSESNPQS